MATESRAAAKSLFASLDGRLALPRKNGELVFEEPWESRAFGMAVALCEAAVFSWDEFRQRLIAGIDSWEHASDQGGSGSYSYYAIWLAALEELLIVKGLCAKHEIDFRTAVED